VRLSAFPFSRHVGGSRGAGSGGPARLFERRSFRARMSRFLRRNLARRMGDRTCRHARSPGPAARCYATTRARATIAACGWPAGSGKVKFGMPIGLIGGAGRRRQVDPRRQRVMARRATCRTVESHTDFRPPRANRAGRANDGGFTGPTRQRKRCVYPQLGPARFVSREHRPESLGECDAGRQRAETGICTAAHLTRRIVLFVAGEGFRLKERAFLLFPAQSCFDRR